jgi:hypothetical protein
VANALSNSQLRHFSVWQGKVDQLDPPVVSLEPSYQPQVGATRQSCFEAEVMAALNMPADLGQEQTARGDPFAFWRERRHSRGNQVRIDEVQTAHFRQVLQRKGRLPGAVGTRDDPAGRPVH